MGKISEMQAPSLPLSGLELVPALQGGDIDANKGVPLLAYGQLPSGPVLKLRVPMLADLSATTDADPGPGKVRWNHATPGSATVLYIDDIDAAAADLSTAFASLSVGGFVYIQADSTSARRDVWQKWQVTSVAAGTGYTQVGVSMQASAGAFVADETLELTLQQPTPSPGVDRNVVTALTSVAGVVTVDWSLGDYFTLTPAENVTSWVQSNVPTCGTISAVLTQGTTPFTVAMPTAQWEGGTPGTFSTTANAVDELSLSTTDTGATLRAVLAKDWS